MGTGDARRLDPSPTNGTGGDGSAGGRTGSADATGTSNGSGVPADIEALFAPPEDDTVTADSIFGVWASVSTGFSTEDRLQITQSSFTLARRCTTDGRIAHVTAKIRVNAGTITVLESKSANLTGACPSHLRLEVEEWMLCASSYGCIWVDGTKMTGLVLPGAYETSWIKLSD